MSRARSGVPGRPSLGQLPDPEPASNYSLAKVSVQETDQIAGLDRPRLVLDMVRFLVRKPVGGVRPASRLLGE